MPTAVGMLRLRSVTDFERVRREGRSHAHPLIVLLVHPRPRPATPEAGPAVGELPITPAPELSRFGFAAGKGVGTAVVRNRAKRLLREAVRAQLPDIEAGWDLVFIARRAMGSATLDQTRAAVKQLLQRAGVLKKNHA